ncbi:MAG: DNA starvation/stationary phase protection protein Dps [Myxococcota bacterium]
MRKFKSSVALPDDVREPIIKQLNVVLATATDLTSQIKQAHWNIKGPEFFARHELFDKVADRTRDMVDEFAERAATLGGYAEGTIRMAGEKTVLEPYDVTAIKGRRHVEVLVNRFGAYTALLRQSIEQVEGKDVATEDLYTEALRQAELDMWFLESHITAATEESK